MSGSGGSGADESEFVVVRVENPANGGDAVGRVDGRVVFVRGAIPGELVRARITEDRHAGYRRAETTEVLESSAHRVEPVCDAARHGAGCCDLGFIEQSHARILKGRVLVDALTRIGKLTADDLEAAGAGEDLMRSLGDDGTRWRVRTRLGVDAQGRPGMHALGGSAIVAGHRCAAPVAGMTDGLDAFAFTPGADLAVAADMDGRRHIVELAPPRPPKRGRARDRRARAQAARRSRDAPRAERVIDGEPVATHQVGNRIWRIPVTGFWQAHREAPAAYAHAVVDMLAAADLPRGPAGMVAWDLYGGAGVFAAGLLDADPLEPVRSVHVVESDAAALASAAQIFDGDDRTLLHRGEVAAVVGDLPSPDVVVLDPPRTGAGPAVIDAIADADPAAIIHVGCDVGRFARDLALFAEHGYRPREIRAFDAFPQTHHVEALACLVPERRRR